MKNKKRKSQLHDDLIHGLRELQAILRAGKRPEEVLTLRTLEVVEPPDFTASAVKRLRNVLGLSTALFAGIMGVSPKLVEQWESGLREPSRLARRLLDAVQRDPAAFVGHTIIRTATRRAA